MIKAKNEELNWLLTYFFINLIHEHGSNPAANVEGSVGVDGQQDVLKEEAKELSKRVEVSDQVRLVRALNESDDSSEIQANMVDLSLLKYSLSRKSHSLKNYWAHEHERFPEYFEECG